jgi:hypothetical protein
MRAACCCGGRGHRRRPVTGACRLVALLQYDEDSEYGHKAYGAYIEVFQALLMKDGESSPLPNGNFQYANARER